ncbi:MAG: DNA polymerase III subunit gamma/tau C-terminal domain-containing protein, partial [Gallionellaceae bacterium]
EWTQLAYDLGLQGLAQEIAVNSIVDSFESNHLRLKLSPELRELVNTGIEKEIRQAVQSKLNVSCKLEIIAEARLSSETPYQARVRVQEELRQAAIVAIRQSETVKKLNRAFGAELVESTVRKIED